MKILTTIFRALFILCLPLFLITASLRIPAVSAYFYEHGFRQNQVGLTTGLDDSQLKVVARGMVGYFNSNQQYINLVVIKDGQPFQLFNEREIDHLKDVKGLFQLDGRVLLITGAFALLYVLFYLFRGEHGRRYLAWGVVGGSALTLGLMVLLGIGIYFGFDQLLLDFHLISFANDFWELNPATDYLIMLIPRDFMVYGTVVCTAVTALGALVLGGAAAGHLWFHRYGDKAATAE